MAIRFGDRVYDTTETTGQGPFTLSDVAVPTFQRPSTFFANGDRFIGYLGHAPNSSDPPPNEWIVALFEYSSAGPSLTVVEIYDGSSGTSAVSFSTGVKQVYAAPNAGRPGVKVSDGKDADAKPANPVVNDQYIATDAGKVYRFDGTDWTVAATTLTVQDETPTVTVSAATTLQFVGASVTDEGDGVAKVDGLKGDTGDTGDPGDDGWSPLLAIVTDNDRRVLQVADWVGGDGDKPATGQYVGASGLTANIAEAVDIRGPAGPNTISGDTTTAFNGVLVGDGSKVGVSTQVAFKNQANTFAKDQTFEGNASFQSLLLNKSGTAGLDLDIYDDGTTAYFTHEVVEAFDVVLAPKHWGNTFEAVYGADFFVHSLNLDNIGYSYTADLAGTQTFLRFHPTMDWDGKGAPGLRFVSHTGATPASYDPATAAAITLHAGGITLASGAVFTGDGSGLTDLSVSWGNLVSVPANVDALGNLVSVTDSLPYFTDSGKMALATLTSFARNLLDDADAATARGTLGATTIGGNTFTQSNPSAVGFNRVNADNTLTHRTPPQVVADINVVVTESGGTGTISDSTHRGRTVLFTDDTPEWEAPTGLTEGFICSLFPLIGKTMELTAGSGATVQAAGTTIGQNGAVLFWVSANTYRLSGDVS